MRFDREGNLAPFNDRDPGDETPGGAPYPGWREVFHGAAIGGAATTGGRGFHSGLCVAPSGEIWHNDMGGFKKENPRGMTMVYIHRPDGSLKEENAIPLLPNGTCGIRVDRQGFVYLGLGAQGEAAAPGLSEPLQNCGYLMKMKPNARCVYGEGPFKMMGFPPAPFKVEGLVWAWYGQHPLKDSHGCVCSNSRLDLDDFARVFVPQCYRSSVMVLDTSGNEILRVGRYGNEDSRGRQSPVPEPEIAIAWAPYVAASDRALYIMDYGNARILRAQLGYHAEQTVVVP
jgi:hypothetical protein